MLNQNDFETFTQKHIVRAKEILDRQLKNLPTEQKLQHRDINRICKNVGESLFSPNECCLWRGYITNRNNLDKGRYVNFYFKKKKLALHRLLYTNLVGSLGDNEYLKFTCPNKGQCCNMLHMRKFRKFQKKDQQQTASSPNKRDRSITRSITVITADELACDWEKYKHKLQVRFD